MEKRTFIKLCENVRNTCNIALNKLKLNCSERRRKKEEDRERGRNGNRAHNWMYYFWYSPSNHRFGILIEQQNISVRSSIVSTIRLLVFQSYNACMRCSIFSPYFKSDGDFWILERAIRPIPSALDFNFQRCLFFILGDFFFFKSLWPDFEKKFEFKIKVHRMKN